MILCRECGTGLDALSVWKCRSCGRQLCGDHRLPENHRCEPELTRCAECGATSASIHKCQKCAGAFCPEHDSPKIHRCATRHEGIGRKMCGDGRCQLNRQGVPHESHDIIEDRPVQDQCNDPRCAMNRMGISHESHESGWLWNRTGEPASGGQVSRRTGGSNRELGSDEAKARAWKQAIPACRRRPHKCMEPERDRVDCLREKLRGKGGGRIGSGARQRKARVGKRTVPACRRRRHARGTGPE